MWRMKEITKQLRVLRADRGLSQLDLGSKANIKEYRYWRIENGYIAPTPEEVAALAQALKCSPSDIVPGVEAAAS